MNDSSSLLDKVNESIQEMRSHAEEVSANSRQAAEEAEHGHEVLKKSVQEIRGVEKTVSSTSEIEPAAGLRADTGTGRKRRPEDCPHGQGHQTGQQRRP